MLHVLVGVSKDGDGLRIARSAANFYLFTKRTEHALYVCGIPTSAGEEPFCRALTGEERDVLERVAAAFRPVPPLEDLLGPINLERRKALLTR